MKLLEVNNKMQVKARDSTTMARAFGAGFRRANKPNEQAALEAKEGRSGWFGVLRPPTNGRRRMKLTRISGQSYMAISSPQELLSDLIIGQRLPLQYPLSQRKWSQKKVEPACPPNADRGEPLRNAKRLICGALNGTDWKRPQQYLPIWHAVCWMLWPLMRG